MFLPEGKKEFFFLHFLNCSLKLWHLSLYHHTLFYLLLVWFSKKQTNPTLQ